MGSTSDTSIPLPDMNDPVNLNFYHQIVALEHDCYRNDRIFNNLNHSYQRALQSIAHSRNLEYEYHNGCARVFRRMTEQISSSPYVGNLDTFFTDSLQESPIQSLINSLPGHDSTEFAAMHETDALSLSIQHTALQSFDTMTMPSSAELLGLSPFEINNGIKSSGLIRRSSNRTTKSAGRRRQSSTTAMSRIANLDPCSSVPVTTASTGSTSLAALYGSQDLPTMPQNLLSPNHYLSTAYDSKAGHSNAASPVHTANAPTSPLYPTGYIPPPVRSSYAPPQQDSPISQTADLDAASAFSDFGGLQQRCGSSSSQPLQQHQTAMPSLNPSQTCISDETTSMLPFIQPDLTTGNDYFYGLNMSPSSQHPQFFDSQLELSNDGYWRDGESDQEHLARVDSVFEDPLNGYQHPQSSRLSRGSSFTSDHPLSSEPPSPSPSNPYGFPTSKSSSRAGSISSLHSDRGRSRISRTFRRNSNGSIYGSGKGEHIFDFNPTRSSSRASSGRSVRTGPLDKIARAGMKAVRAIGGACWRCKILGKKCTAETPCDSCPKRRTTPPKPWEAVGCRRGTLRDEIQPINLCPQSYCEGNAYIHHIESASDALYADTPCKQHNDQDSEAECPYCISKAADEECLALGSSQAFIEAIRQRQDIAYENVARDDVNTLSDQWVLTKDNHSHLPAPSDSTLGFLLSQCIPNIVRVYSLHPGHLSTLSLFDGTSETALENFVMLSKTAAIYQAKVENDPHVLIVQSLNCLHESLYVLQSERFTDPTTVERYRHNLCNQAVCEVPKVDNLSLTLAAYINGLSLVLFKKENLRGKKWWMSVFYSLVIQSVVRKLLLRLVEHFPPTPASIKQYLHLGVRLFIASSGKFDPLALETSCIDLDSLEQGNEEEYKAAKLAVGHKNWEALGIKNSGAYLQRLFEDDAITNLQSPHGRSYPFGIELVRTDTGASDTSLLVQIEGVVY